MEYRGSIKERGTLGLAAVCNSKGEEGKVPVSGRGSVNGEESTCAGGNRVRAEGQHAQPNIRSDQDSLAERRVRGRVWWHSHPNALPLLPTSPGWEERKVRVACSPKRPSSAAKASEEDLSCGGRP
eukprot:352911-Chlamydomonas_euryale.AAC.13